MTVLESALVRSLHEQAVHEYRVFCRGARLAELHGQWVRRYDATGHDPLSITYGRVRAFEAIDEIDPADLLTVREDARAEAERLYRDELIAAWQAEEDAA